jgi:four helix bundle suffix protein
MDRHLQALSAAFEREGGFTERLYRVRSRGRQTGFGDTVPK